MDKSASSSSSTETPVVIPPKEKILFEIAATASANNPKSRNLNHRRVHSCHCYFCCYLPLRRWRDPDYCGSIPFDRSPQPQQIFKAGSTTYVLTNQRLIIFTVGFGPKERSIPLEQIQDLKYRSSGLQRFYGAGEIIVNLKGLRESVRLFGLKDVKRRTEQIQSAAKKAQNKA